MKNEDDLLRSKAPWRIPASAQCEHQLKNGDHQIKFTWKVAGWNYEARWHEQTPNASVIDYPSWRLDRIKPGKGFGPDAAPRINETRVGEHWVPTSEVRYRAWQINHGITDPQAISLIKQVHRRAK